jgi:peroxiredoxin
MRDYFIVLFKINFCFFFLILLFSFNDSHIDKVVSDFQLFNVDGKFVSLKDYPDAKGFIIVFTCNHCPFAKLYPERLNALNLKYNPSGVPLIAISSTDTTAYEEDGYTKMIEKAKNEKFNFPYLYDGLQTTAKEFKAQKTPHAFVIWKENGQWIIKYNGAIDDNGAEPAKVQKQYVIKAVDNLLNGKEVEIAETKSIGCQIHFRK